MSQNDPSATLNAISHCQKRTSRSRASQPTLCARRELIDKGEGKQSFALTRAKAVRSTSSAASLGSRTFALTRAKAVRSTSSAASLGSRIHLLVLLLPATFTMVQSMSYNTISHVIDTWEQLRRMKNYEEVAGVKLFQKLFNECKETKPLFGFPIDIDPNSEELLKSRRFIMHASYLIQMIDTALNMLGPDIELLTEIMAELGQKHVKYGVKPEHFPTMGVALVETLQEMLGDSFTEPAKEAWIETYDALSGDMVDAQLAMKK